MLPPWVRLVVGSPAPSLPALLLLSLSSLATITLRLGLLIVISLHRYPVVTSLIPLLAPSSARPSVGCQEIVIRNYKQLEVNTLTFY